MYSQLMRSYSTYNPDAPNQLISNDDLCADCRYWYYVAPSAGPAVMLGRATLHLNRTSSMLRMLSEKLEQDKVLLAYHANQLSDHKLVLEIHQNDPHILERGIVMKWRAQIIANLESQIKVVRMFETSIITLQGLVAGLSPKTMGPFQSSCDVLGLNYGEYTPVDPCE